MGMGSSQARLCSITCRQHHITYELTNIACQVESLDRDMLNVTKKYKQALYQKSLKWSTNSGVTYVDMTYSNLMRPGAVNQNTPYLITDNGSGRVVVDSKYEEWAKYISEDGTPGGDWESVRAYVLSQLLGFDEDDLEKEYQLSQAVKENQYIVDNMDPNDPEYEDAKLTFDESVDALEQVFSKDQERQIEYYDKLFRSMAEKGWVYNENINDSEYFNQLLQNGNYTITTVNECYDAKGKPFFDYSADFASNCKNVVAVNDTELNQRALIEYEDEKSNIDAKEKRLEARKTILNTEYTANKEIIEGIKKVIQGNIERTMKLNA